MDKQTQGQDQRESSEKVVLQECRFGRGAFAGRAIHPGEVLLECGGPKVRREQLPSPYSPEYDHYLQIGPDLYLGPSGGLDDFVNHSCTPNAGLKFLGDRVILVALSPIEPGSEISFDYSTTMLGDDWQMKCGCGSDECRSVVRNFDTLPPHKQQQYIELGVVPSYVIDGVGKHVNGA